MKVKASVKVMCKDCKIVHRNGRVAVVCSSLANGGRHKQRQG